MVRSPGRFCLSSLLGVGRVNYKLLEEGKGKPVLNAAYIESEPQPQTAPRGESKLQGAQVGWGRVAEGGGSLPAPPPTSLSGPHPDSIAPPSPGPEYSLPHLGKVRSWPGSSRFTFYQPCPRHKPLFFHLFTFSRFLGSSSRGIARPTPLLPRILSVCRWVKGARAENPPWASMYK